MAATIKKKPKVTVKSVSVPERGDNGAYVMSVNINLGSSLVNTNSERRATRMYYGWILGANVSKPEAKSSLPISSSNKEFSKTKNIANFNGYTRTSFYPYTSTKLNSVTFYCQPYNGKGRSSKVSQTRYFYPPATPTVSALSVDSSTGIVSCTITSDLGHDYHERVRTRYRMTIRNTLTNRTWTHADGSFTGASMSLSYNASQYQQLAYGDYISITVQAWSQGYAGDSGVASMTYYMSYPAAATIRAINVSSKSATGKCTVLINTNSNAYHPVDSVKLEYLANVTYSTAASIPGDAAWTASNITDDADCTALAMPVANLIPDPGKYTWIRVKSWHAIEGVLYRYSEPQRVKALETPAPTAADDEIKILSTALGADKASIVVTMGWNADGQDDSTGTELSWADADDAWRSTEQPDTFEFTWSDGSLSSGGVTYRDSAKVTIKNLKMGQAVFVRARRYLDTDSGRSYGAYSNAKANIPTSAVVGEVGSVSLSLPGFVASGSSALASWTIGGGEEQKSWALVTSGGVTLAEGSGITSSYQIPFERLEAMATDNELTLHLEASTGGDPIESSSKTITIVEAPTLTASVGSTLTAQPLSFGLSCNMAARIVATITAQGTAGQSPGGVVEQYSSDCVWYMDANPVWTIVSETSYTATVTLDSGQPFVDGASYTLTAHAVDDATGLKSDTVTASFAVAWLHQAVAAEDSTVTPSDYYDEDGVHHMSAQVAIVGPTGATGSDVYDVYRYTADGAVLIGSGYPAGETVTDEYAPYGAGMDLFYRVATRTVDGDVEFADIDYELGGDVLRFDWPYGTLELPYNIEISDSYSKSTDRRQHIDGGNEIYWNNAVRRTAKYSSTLIRLESQEDIASARQMARYPGAVFVRTPDGSAFEADVQISDMSTNYPLQVFSLSIEEVGTTQNYMLPPYETDVEDE